MSTMAINREEVGGYIDLSKTERAVLQYIRERHNLSKMSIAKGDMKWIDSKGVYCFITHEALATFVGCCLRTISRAIHKLCERGVLYIEKRYGHLTDKTYITEYGESVTPELLRNAVNKGKRKQLNGLRMKQECKDAAILQQRCIDMCAEAAKNENGEVPTMSDQMEQNVTSDRTFCQVEFNTKV